MVQFRALRLIFRRTRRHVVGRRIARGEFQEKSAVRWVEQLLPHCAEPGESFDNVAVDADPLPGVGRLEPGGLDGSAPYRLC